MIAGNAELRMSQEPVRSSSGKEGRTRLPVLASAAWSLTAMPGGSSGGPVKGPK